MSKVLDATCVGGIVKVGALPVPGTTILSEGIAASQGLLILDGDKKTYIAKTSPDLDSTLSKVIDSLDTLSSALNQIATTLTSIGANMTGPTTAPPGSLATDVAQIILKATALDTVKAELETLQEALK